MWQCGEQSRDSRDVPANQPERLRLAPGAFFSNGSYKSCSEYSCGTSQDWSPASTSMTGSSDFNERRSDFAFGRRITDDSPSGGSATICPRKWPENLPLHEDFLYGGSEKNVWDQGDASLNI